MKTIEYLTDPRYMAFFWPVVIAGLAIAVVCSVLSPLVVLKRLSFVGQGISHAAFGGIGIAAVVGVVGGAASSSLQFAIVLVFCLAAALVIGWLIERGASEADTSIGIVLVGSMTLGALLIAWATALGRARTMSWESILFGSIVNVDRVDAVTAWAATGLVLAAAWWFRRPMLFWAFDEPAARAFGVSTSAMKYLLIVLLTLAIVTAMKLAGAVLATALLVLPGAAALRLSDRFVPVMSLAVGAGLLGVIGGLVLSFEVGGLPPGACIVAVLVLIFAGARLASGVQSGRSAS